MTKGTTVLLLALAAGFGASAAAADTLRSRLNTDIRSINPGVNRDDSTDGVVLHMVEGLVANSANGTPKPLLAETIETSPDGLTYTFKLRKGVKFHDGSTLTAEDVVWNWRRYMDPKTGWLCTGEYNGANGLKAEIAAPDADTVVFTLNQPSSVFLAGMARSQCGQTAIIARSSVNPDGSFKTPVGTGPFKFGEWRRGEYIRLDRFADYADRGGPADGYVGGKKPLVDAVQFIVIPDDATAKAALMSGKLDILASVSATDAPELRAKPDIAVTSAPTMMFSTILLQTRDPLLSNVKMRQAIAAALDFRQIAQSVTDGLVPANASIVATASRYYSSEQKRGFAYDPAKAARLLKEAGYTGQRIVLMANKNERDTYETAVIAQSMLQAAGLNVDLEIVEWATQLDRYSKGNYQMQSFSYSARYDPALAYSAVIGSKDVRPNRIWDNAEAEDLLRKIVATTKEDERQVLFDKLHELFLDQAPFLMLFNGVEVSAASKRVKGFAASTMPKPRLWEVSVSK
ncbi:MAG: ABC transporter substrate-binding protein [Proteobacteria bacterium]|nr:ABC transporter substrate-binding protein [Pseudomonadota bacterium]